MTRVTEQTEGAAATPAPEAGAAATPEGSTTPATAPEAAATPETTPTTDAGEWRASIADDKVRKLADRYTSPAELAKALSEANSEISKRVKVPGEGASEEEVAKYRKSIGVPDKADAYEVARPEHIAEDMFKSEAVQGVFNGLKAAAHQHNLSQTQLDGLTKWYFAHEAETMQAVTKADEQHMAAAEASLRKEWGKDYDLNLAYANEALGRFGGIHDMELKGGTLLRNHPAFVKTMAEFGRATGEGQPQLGLHGSEAGVNAKNEIAKLTSQIHDAHAKGDSAMARSLDAQRSKLTSQLYGDGAIVGAGGRAR
jgi:hypothetical protein